MLKSYGLVIAEKLKSHVFSYLTDEFSYERGWRRGFVGSRGRSDSRVHRVNARVRLLMRGLTNHSGRERTESDPTRFG